MKSDDLQIWMLTAFIIVLTLGLYKIYIIFSKPALGISTETEHEELRDIIVTFIKDHDLIEEVSEKALFELLIQEENFDNTRYKSFNLNRYHQLIQQLFYIHSVNSLSELIKSIKTNADYNA